MAEKWDGRRRGDGLMRVWWEKSEGRTKQSGDREGEGGYGKKVGYKAELNHDLIMSISAFWGLPLMQRPQWAEPRLAGHAGAQVNLTINDAVFFYAFIQIMNLKLLTSLALLSVVLAQCPPNYDIPNLAAGSLQFALKTGAPNSIQKFQYPFPTPFPSAPSVALALQDFSLSSLTAHAFYVLPANVTSSSVLFNFAYTAPIWSIIRFNFWASANPQIQLGFFSNSKLTVSGNSAVVSTSIQQAFGTGDNPVVRVFLNGYQASSSAVQIAVSPSNLQGTTLSVKIMFGPTTQITGIWLSWIAFSPVTASFSAYGGSVGRNSFVGSFNSDVSNNLYQNSYLLYGLTQISINGQDSLAYSCQISNNFQLSLSSSRNFDSLGLVYIVAGNAPSKLCAACGANNVVYGNSCLSSCPLGTTANTYKDGGVACLGTAVSGATSAASSAPTASNVLSGLNPGVVAPTAAAPVASASSTSASTASPSSSSSSSTSVSCPPNAIFNGNECVCDVGYGYINGQCTALSVASAIPVVINPPSSSSSSSSSSTPATVTPASNSSTSQSSASQTVQPKPSTSGSVNCPANSYDNGLGTCVCNSGFYFTAQGCLQGAPCPANSTRQPNGSCKCDAGLTNYNGFCSKCPSGALWSSQSNSCIFVCGQNSIYSTSANACTCNPGYGLINGQCQTCPNNYFISNGYCVTCPVNSVLNSATNTCDCLSGYYTNQFGVCTQKCGTNEEYDTVSQQCTCLSGLGRVNGVCTVCPAGSKPSSDGSSCSVCADNEQLVGGVCVCQAGFALNSARVCTPCAKLPNGFIINGVCSVCPSNLVYNGNQGCSCPSGKVLQGSTCVSQCKQDQLQDSNGNCYTCGNNQVISNGKCVCSNGYTLSSCGICVLSCGSNQFVFQGACASCPLNTVYNTQINSCACPTGYYKDTYGICQQLVLKPISCNAGQYFDSTQGCITCPGSCKTCSSATQCLTCSTDGYSPNLQGVCTPTCGDGLILGSETCDSGLSYTAGCVGCQVQNNWSCSGQPSVCVQRSAPTPTPTVTPTPTPTPTPSNRSNTGSNTGSAGVSNLNPLYQSGTATINSNNVFVTLKTNPTFTFDNPTEMQSFIKAEFASGPKPTVYCSQRQSPNLDTFDCLLIYPSGVPNQAFNINFSYNYKSKSGAVAVKVDPFAATNNRDSSRGRG